ncbi:MAG: hypothetical protein M1835_005891 [Candelina submexicana]|nr:MAG: hypothetical protein M1835_005891 [Candelina submexicana]
MRNSGITGAIALLAYTFLAVQATDTPPKAMAQYVEDGVPSTGKVTLPLQWDQCTTWQSIWQHTSARIDQISFGLPGGSGDYRIIVFKDQQCKDFQGYIPNASNGQTVAITANGKNTTPKLRTEAEPGVEADIGYPADDFSHKGAFKVELGKCNVGWKWSGASNRCVSEIKGTTVGRRFTA